MPEITLPRRTDRSSGRRQPGRAPTAADVPRIGLARDPGLRVNPRAFTAAGEALEGFGQTVSKVGGQLADEVEEFNRKQGRKPASAQQEKKVEKEAQRQQRLTDATESAKARSAYASVLREGFDQRQAFGFGEEAVRGEFDTFIDNQGVDALRQVGGKISEEARMRFEESVSQIADVFKSRAASTHLNALKQAGLAELRSAGAAAADRVRQDPDTLSAELAQLKDTTKDFSGGFPNDEDLGLLERGRLQIIESGLVGLVERGRVEEARALIGQDIFAGALDETARKRIAARLDREERDVRQVERARVADLIEIDITARAATGQGVEGLSEDRIAAALGDDGAADYRDRRARAGAVHETMLALRSATLEEGGEIVARALPALHIDDGEGPAVPVPAIQTEWRRQRALRDSDPASASMQSPGIASLFENPPPAGPLAELENSANIAQERALNPDADFLSALRIRREHQRGLGVDFPRLFQRAEAGRLADRLGGMTEGRAETLFALRESYGDLFPTLIGELGERDFGGLSPELQLLAATTDNDAPPALSREMDQAFAADATATTSDTNSATTSFVRERLGPALVAAEEGDAAPTPDSVSSDDDTEFEDDFLFDDDDGVEDEISDPADSPLFQGIRDRLSRAGGSGAGRPTGRLGPGLDAAKDANLEREVLVEPVDPLLAEFVGAINPAARLAMTVGEGTKAFGAFREMKDAQTRGDQEAVDDARDRMVGALLSAVPGGRMFSRAKAAKAGIAGKASPSADKVPPVSNKAATTGGGRGRKQLSTEQERLKVGGRGKKAQDNSKNERHGDDSALEKAERRNNKLKERLETTPNKKERNKLKTKMRNNKRNAEKSRKGTEHGKRGR